MKGWSLQRWRGLLSLRTLDHSGPGLRHFAAAAVPPSAPAPSAENPEVKTLSRWQVLKAARRAAPPPKRRSTYTFDQRAEYSLADALTHVRASSWASFDETLEVVFRLNLDPRRAEQNIRGTAALPHGTGKPVKVAVFAFPGPLADGAREAGADLVGGEELIDQVARSKGSNLKGFAACVATPEIVPKMAAAVGRILGPKGMMPNKKTGSVTGQPGEAVEKLKRGQVGYRVDRFGSVAARVGKLSFEDGMLTENLLSVTRAIMAARPEVVKKKYMLSVHMSSSMGPSARLEPIALSKLALDPQHLPPSVER